MRETIQHLQKLYFQRITQNTRLYLRNLYNHVVQIIESMRNMILYMSFMSNSMNKVMRVLTVIATLFTPFTFLAGYTE